MELLNQIGEVMKATVLRQAALAASEFPDQGPTFLAQVETLCQLPPPKESGEWSNRQFAFSALGNQIFELQHQRFLNWLLERQLRLRRVMG
jgi:hypothetical protein